MSDPLNKATVQPLATLGEGCLSRYDLEVLGQEIGAEFADAARLWHATQWAVATDVAALDAQAEEI